METTTSSIENHGPAELPSSKESHHSSTPPPLDRRLSANSMTMSTPPTMDIPTDSRPIQQDPEADREKGSKVVSSDDYPDGGIKAWLVVAGAWCCLFVSFGWITCIGVFQDYYSAHQLRTYSSSTVAWISSVETFMLFVGAPVCGKVFDGWGPVPLLLFGTFFHVFGLMMVSLSQQYYQFFLAQSICSALGASALFWGANNAVGTWFRRRRAFALGIVSSGSSIGGLVGTAMIPNLFDPIGFGWTMRVVAFMFLFLLIIANCTVRSRLDHKPSTFRPLDFIRPLRETPLVILTLASFFFFMGVFLPYNFLVVEARDNGMSPSLANYLLTVLSATSIFGRIVPGWTGDRYGRFNTIIVTTYLSSLFTFAVWIPAHNNAVKFVYAALYGFSSGAFVAMVPALIAQVCSDIKRIGAYMGAAYIVISPAILAGQPIAGALVFHADYTYLKVFSGIMMFIGGTLFIVARAAYDGAGWKRI